MTDEQTAARRVERIRHELQRRDVEVVRVEPITPGLVAITFAGEALAGFRSDGFDDHVKFIFDNEAGEQVKRDYTPRRFDAERRELTLEFVLHGEGEASQWAERAAIGSKAIIGGPKSSMVIPTDYAWHLLVGDSAALPAIRRRLEELPEGVEVFVLVQCADSERVDLASKARLELRWLSPDADLEATLRDFAIPSAQGFAWCAGEAGLMARLRQVLLVERGFPRQAARIAAYWKKNEQGSFHETLESGLA